jgi:hypothetical protein
MIDPRKASLIALAFTLFLPCKAAEGPAKLPAYLRHGDEPSMKERHPDAPPLQADRSVLEAFAVSHGLVVAQVRHSPEECPKLKGIPAGYQMPASCVLLLNLVYEGTAAEGYVVLYDQHGQAYAVESNYEYTGL